MASLGELLEYAKEIEARNNQPSQGSRIAANAINSFATGVQNAPVQEYQTQLRLLDIRAKMAEAKAKEIENQAQEAVKEQYNNAFRQGAFATIDKTRDEMKSIAPDGSVMNSNGTKFQQILDSAESQGYTRKFTMGKGGYNVEIAKKPEPVPMFGYLDASGNPIAKPFTTPEGQPLPQGAKPSTPKIPSGEGGNSGAIDKAAAESLGKSLASYSVPYPSAFALRTPTVLEAIKIAQDINPSFNAAVYPARQKLMADFTSGKSANNLRSLNTAIGHIQSLQKAGDALNNLGLQIWNKIANAGLSAVGDPRANNFLAAATAVQSELAAVFKGMGATDQEINAWRQNINSSKSPEQIKGFVKTAVDLLNSRLVALKRQYEAGMDNPGDFENKFLNDKSKDIIQNLGLSMDIQGEERTPKPRDVGQKTGGRLAQDAQGNKAIVYPDGTFEEVK